MKHLRIKNIKKIPKEDRYDLRVDSTHNFFANGILIHNTSHRVGNVLVDKELSFFEKLAKFFKVEVRESYWKYLSGTRRVVLEESTGEGFHDPTIRDKAFKFFDSNLRKGETVYLEIVGYESTGASIMSPGSTEKLDDKSFVKQYGKTMYYSYGCEPKQSDFYVYRMTMTNEDGHSMDYSWDDVVRRCNEIGVKHVPLIRKLTLDELYQIDLKQGGTGDDRNLKEMLAELVDAYVKGPSLVDSRHIREGVCVRIESGLVNKTYKAKSFEFKIMEGHAKDSGAVDMEEAS